MAAARGGGLSGSGTAYETVARAESERGEVVLRRRATEQDGFAHELRVNGVAVMDTLRTASEQQLATSTLALIERPRRLMVGGLGLGFTLRALLADDRVEHVIVAEREPAVVEWMSGGMVPETAGVLESRRVEVRIGDVQQIVADAATGSLDGVLLDVDNGPGFLVHNANAALYEDEFLSVCASRLRQGGAVAVWSSDESAVLRAAMVRAVGRCEHEKSIATRSGRPITYHVYVALQARQPGPSGAAITP